MINTVWESAAWQSDMQLIGKVALSATAVFILALAYRFYKLRKLESSGANGKHDPGCDTDKSTANVETPPRDYTADETGNLRFRCVHNNLQNSSVTDHRGNKNVAEVSRAERQAQEGLLTDEVTCKDQRGLKNEETEQQLSKDGPPQSQRQPRDESDGQTDDCKKALNKTQGRDCRQDPEGREMQEKSLLVDGEMQEKSALADGSTGQHSKDLPPSHNNQTKEKPHQIFSTQMPNEITTNGGPPQVLTAGGLREKMVETSSQSVTDEVDLHFDSGLQGLQPPLTDLPPFTEEGDISIMAQQQPTNGESSQPQEQNAFTDHHVKEDKDNNTETKGIRSTLVSSVNASSSLSNQGDQDSGGVVQSRPNTHHSAFNAESLLDVDLENCYEVLCSAKKNNQEALIAAAYKSMSDNYLDVLQNPTIYGRLNAMERDLILEGRMKGRRFVVVADIDTQATNAAENKSSLSYYDSDYDQWHALSNIPIEAVSRGGSMATLFNYLFIALGSDGLDRQMKPSKRVLCYNPLTDSWREVAPLKEARPHCKLVALDGYLYAIGGECLHTVERYDPRLNRWSYVAPLPNDTFAVAHMATAYDEEIYVTGGTIRYMLLRYNHREKIWKNSLISGSKERTTEIIANNNFLYRFDLNRNMGISVHRCNIRARIWYECATYAMPYPTPFQCVVIDNNIYCISRNFHLRFLADDVSPRFMEMDLQTVPLPKGILYPIVLVLPLKGTQ